MVGRDDQARDFTYGNGEEQHAPKPHSAKGGEICALRIGETNAEQQDEEGVNA